MLPKAFVHFTVVVLWMVSPMAAAPTDPTAKDLEELRAALLAIRETQAANQSTALNKSLTELAAASASPQSAISAYVDAVRIDKFGTDHGTNSKFQDWRKANSDVLSHPALRAAAQLHLKYLKLTLERARKPDGEPDLAAIVSFVNEAAETNVITTNPDEARLNKDGYKQLKEWIKQLQDEPIEAGPFVKAYRIRPLFSGLTDWEMTPGNISSILDKTVRPVLREANDPRLIETWDLQIASERAVQGERNRDDPDSDFNRNQIPRLRWLRAKDQYAIGNKSEALQAMLSIIGASPEHPDNLSWIASLSELLDEATADQATPTGNGDAGT